MGCSVLPAGQIAEEFDENGDPDGYEVYAGRSGKPFNYFTRQELDLILAIGADAEMEDGLSLTDGYGHYTGGDGVWEKTVNDVYDDYKLAYVEAVDDSYYTAFQGRCPSTIRCLTATTRMKGCPWSSM